MKPRLGQTKMNTGTRIIVPKTKRPIKHKGREED